MRIPFTEWYVQIRKPYKDEKKFGYEADLVEYAQCKWVFCYFFVVYFNDWMDY